MVVRFFVVPERDGDDFATVVNSLRDSRPGHAFNNILVVVSGSRSSGTSDY